MFIIPLMTIVMIIILIMTIVMIIMPIMIVAMIIISIMTIVMFMIMIITQTYTDMVCVRRGHSKQIGDQKNVIFIIIITFWGSCSVTISQKPNCPLKFLY